LWVCRLPVTGKRLTYGQLIEATTTPA
jgi:hypothetical protein